MVGFRVLFVPRTAARVVVIEYGFACVSVLQLIVFQGLSGTGKGTTTAKLKVGWGHYRVMSGDIGVHAAKYGCGKHGTVVWLIVACTRVRAHRNAYPTRCAGATATCSEASRCWR